MVSWAGIGHGMRRRMGAPSSHHESAGANMNRQHYTSDEAYELASQQSSSRIPMGDDAYMGAGQNDEFSPEQFQGTLVPKQGAQSADPSDPGSKANRMNALSTGERMGAAYRVTSGVTGLVDPTVGPTQSSGRIVPSVHGRNTVDFASAEQSSYL
jgi:hypothetical protein